MEVPPARFCLYFVGAKAILNLGYWAVNRTTPLYTPDSASFVAVGLAAYILDGIAWLLYFQAIVHSPIAIVGTLSAAYPALTVLLARLFLDEMLEGAQYAGVALVIAGWCVLSATRHLPESRGAVPG